MTWQYRFVCWFAGICPTHFLPAQPHCMKCVFLEEGFRILQERTVAHVEFAEDGEVISFDERIPSDFMWKLAQRRRPN